MYLFLLLHAVQCVEIQISGNVGFDLRIRSNEMERNHTTDLYHRVTRLMEDDEDAPTEAARPTVVRGRDLNLTGCRYPCPHHTHIRAIISQMMNEFAKMSNGVSEFLSAAMAPTSKPTRFTIISAPTNDLFETIFANMTAEFRTFYASYRNRDVCSEADPCENQDSVKLIWRALLEQSVNLLSDASRRYILQYVKERQVPARSALWGQLEQLLARGLGEARAAQLRMLCEEHQLCYSELL